MQNAKGKILSIRISFCIPILHSHFAFCLLHFALHASDFAYATSSDDGRGPVGSVLPGGGAAPLG
jgi:hypothetical protein